MQEKDNVIRVDFGGNQVAKTRKPMIRRNKSILQMVKELFGYQDHPVVSEDLGN